MEPKRSKYDTNPLDQDVADRATESFEAHRPAAPAENIEGAQTQAIRNPAETSRPQHDNEAPTRMMGDKVTSYPSVFVPPIPRAQSIYEAPRVQPSDIYQPPPPAGNIYQAPPFPVGYKPGPHKVAGLGISEKWASMLPYIPGHIGAVAAVIELLFVPRSETRTRFHAAQGLALQIAILVLTGAFGFLTLFSGNSFGSGLFRFAAFIFLIVAMIRVWKGKPFHVSPLDEPAKWLDDKIKPRK